MTVTTTGDMLLPCGFCPWRASGATAAAGVTADRSRGRAETQGEHLHLGGIASFGRGIRVVPRTNEVAEPIRLRSSHPESGSPNAASIPILPYRAASVEVDSRIARLANQLEANEADLVDDGSDALPEASKNQALRICRDILWAQADNSLGTMDDLAVTLFGRDDGCVDVLIDCPASAKRLSIVTGEPDRATRVFRVSSGRAHEQARLEHTHDATRHLGWLTRAD